MQKFIVQLAIWLLKKDLSLMNKTKLLNAILDKLSMLPLRRIIEVSENGSLIIKGKELDLEETNLLRESAKVALLNRAEQLVEDETLYTAYSFGVNGSKCFDDIYASKMAIWWGLERHKHLKILAGQSSDLLG
jgi:hypothetical protein